MCIYKKKEWRKSVEDKKSEISRLICVSCTRIRGRIERGKEKAREKRNFLEILVPPRNKTSLESSFRPWKLE